MAGIGGKKKVSWRKVLLFAFVSLILLPGLAFAILYVPPAGWTSSEVITGKHPGYPGIAPHVYDMSVENTALFAAEAARRAGWEVKRTDRQTGEVEAVATLVPVLSVSDVLVTITPSAENPRHSVVTVRAKSRLGGGDLGANAHHIRTLQTAMDDKLPQVRS